MEWEKKSTRLWTAEVDGRRFRIERGGDAYRNGGGVKAVEVNALFRELQSQYFPHANLAKKHVEEEWLTTPAPDEAAAPARPRLLATDLSIGNAIVHRR